MNISLRRVVTGHAPNGKSTVIRDELLPAGAFAHDRFVWTTGASPGDNSGDDDAANVPHTLEPQSNGSIFRVIEFPPQSAMLGLSSEQKDAFFRDLFAGMGAAHCRVDTTRSPGMHKTATVDYVIVLRGEVTLLLDEGEAILKPGDLVVQRGTNHDWLVQGEEPVLLGVVMLSAKAV